MIQLAHPYLLFLGDAADQLAAKRPLASPTGGPNSALVNSAFPTVTPTSDCPTKPSPKPAAGARTLIIGVANRGGTISDLWRDTFLQAIDLGYDLASGLHTAWHHPRLGRPRPRKGHRLVDARFSDRAFPIATGVKRPGKRLLTVGTDCSVGKMFTALAIEREMQARGMACTFRATGQTASSSPGPALPLTPWFPTSSPAPSRS